MKTVTFVARDPQTAQAHTNHYASIVRKLKTAESVKALEQIKQRAAALNSQGKANELDEDEFGVLYRALSSTGYDPSCSDDFVKIAAKKLDLEAAKYRAQSSVTFVPEDAATAQQNRGVYVHRYLAAMKNEAAVEKLDGIAKRAAAINPNGKATEIDEGEAETLFWALSSTGYSPAISDEFVEIAGEKLDLRIARNEVAGSVKFALDNEMAAQQYTYRFAHKYLDALKTPEDVARLGALAHQVAGAAGEIDADGTGMLFGALEAANKVTAIGFPGFFDAAEANLELRLAQRAAGA